MAHGRAYLLNDIENDSDFNDAQLRRGVFGLVCATIIFVLNQEVYTTRAKRDVARFRRCGACRRQAPA